MDEIRVFMEPMDDDPLFHFQILQMSRGGSKSLSIPRCLPHSGGLHQCFLGKCGNIYIYWQRIL